MPNMTEKEIQFLLNNAITNKNYYRNDYPSENLFFYWSGRVAVYEFLLGKGAM